MISSGDTFMGMREQEAQTLEFLDNLFNCAEEEIPPLVNIITRTHNREEMFDIMNESIYEQTYPNINQIIGSDIDCGYVDEYIPLYMEEPKFVPMPNGYYYSPWNKYLETLAEEVELGWVCYMDDDDMYTSKTAIEEIMSYITSENDLLVWKVSITPDFIVPSHSFGKQVTAGDISGIGMMFHSKHLPVQWGNISYGDYRVAKQLADKGLNIIWIDKVLSTTQKGAHNGK